MTTKFEVRKNSIEVPYKKRNLIKQGCAAGVEDSNPEIIESYSDKETALEALKNFKTEVARMAGQAHSYYIVTEYYVEENSYDEDGEWVSGGDVWGITAMPEFEE